MTDHDDAMADAALYVRSKETLFADVGEDVVALNVAQGECYGLTNVVASVWKLLEEPHSLDALCKALELEFEVAPAECRRDVARLLAELRAEGLVETTSN